MLKTFFFLLLFIINSRIFSLSSSYGPFLIIARLWSILKALLWSEFVLNESLGLRKRGFRHNFISLNVKIDELEKFINDRDSLHFFKLLGITIGCTFCICVYITLRACHAENFMIKTDRYSYLNFCYLQKVDMLFNRKI